MSDKLEYRESNYFEENKTYFFEDSLGTFEAEVKFDNKKGYYYTVSNKFRGSEYKVTSIKCKELE
jgi:hypothetical protein